MFAVGNIAKEAGLSLDRFGMRLQADLAVTEELSRHRRLLNLGDKKPVIGVKSFVAPSASIVGDVTVGNRSSVWYAAVIRGDMNKVEIGNNTSIQDRAVIHVGTGLKKDLPPTKIGNNVLIASGAILHQCTIQDGSLIGMGAQLLNGVTVEGGAIVAAGSVVPPGVVVRAGEVWAGSPARKLRAVTEEEKQALLQEVSLVHQLSMHHAEECDKGWEEVESDKLERKLRLERTEDFESHVGLLHGTQRMF